MEIRVRVFTGECSWDPQVEEEEEKAEGSTKAIQSTSHLCLLHTHPVKQNKDGRAV